jgi:DNA processing protein
MQNIKSKNEDNIYYAWLSSQLGTCSAAFKKLYETYGSGKTIFECTDYSQVKLTDNQRSRLMDKNLSKSKKSIDTALYSGFVPISYENEFYPEKLKDLSNPPPIFYTRGKLLNFDKYYCVGIVGTRKPSKEAMEFVKNAAYSLAKEGVIIISGLAFGIDSEAHASTLQAKGFTLGISGVKAGQVYPKENEYLYDTIYKRGAVICEHSPTDTVEKSTFPMRNRIISALSDVLIMAEAPIKSGALITAEKSFSLKKTVCVPTINSKTNEGGLSLLEKGALPIDSHEIILNNFYAESKRQFLSSDELEKNYFGNTKIFSNENFTSESSYDEDTDSLIPTKHNFENAPQDTLSDLSDIENKVYNYILSQSSVSTDQIIKNLDLSGVDAASSASMLEIYGYIRRMPGDKWSII